MMQQPAAATAVVPGIPGPPREPPDTHEVHKMYYIGLIILYVIVILPAIAGHWFNIIFYPITFGTAFAVYYYYTRQVNMNLINPMAIKFADLFRAFGLTFYSAGILALVFELWIQLIFILMLAAGQLGQMAKQAGSSNNKSSPFANPSNPIAHVYNFLNAFFVAALVEESLKAFIIQHCMKRFLPYKDYLGNQDVRTVVWLGMVVGLGFGTVEGVMYVCVYGYLQGEGLAGLLITWLIRVLIAIPFHFLTGLMWGINYAKRDCLKQTISWPMMYLAPWLFHGFYDFIEMEYALAAKADETVGMALGGLGIAVAIEIIAGVFVWFQLKNLYLEASQYRVPDHDPVN